MQLLCSHRLRVRAKCSCRAMPSKGPPSAYIQRCNISPVACVTGSSQHKDPRLTSPAWPCMKKGRLPPSELHLARYKNQASPSFSSPVSSDRDRSSWQLCTKRQWSNIRPMEIKKSHISRLDLRRVNSWSFSMDGPELDILGRIKSICSQLSASWSLLLTVLNPFLIPPQIHILPCCVGTLCLARKD